MVRAKAELEAPSLPVVVKNSFHAPSRLETAHLMVYDNLGMSPSNEVASGLAEGRVVT